MFKRKEEPKGGISRLTDAQVRVAADEAASELLAELDRQGFAAQAERQAAAAYVLEIMAVSRFKQRAKQLWDDGGRGQNQFEAISEDVNRVQAEVVQRLAESGLSVDHVAKSYVADEAG